MSFGKFVKGMFVGDTDITSKHGGFLCIVSNLNLFCIFIFNTETVKNDFNK